MRIRKDITGQRFGRLVAVRPDGYRGRRIMWLFKCDCGKEHVAIGENVWRGLAKSCGCLRVDVATAIGSHLYPAHGDSGHGKVKRIYRIWQGMLRRCNSPKHINYRWYGGRGISVAPKWRHYQVFRSWAYANGYADGLTIDRIDPDQDYSPANCRWVTLQANSSRRRNAGTVTNAPRVRT